MYMIYVIVAVLSCIVGYSVGRLSCKPKYKNENPQQTILVGDNILLNANDNREIASLVCDTGSTEKQETLEELVKIINNAAISGRTFIFLQEEFSDLDKKIEKYFTKREILDFFKDTNYVIDFRWGALDYSNIRKISW